MNDEREPLSPEIDAFLDVERRRPAPPPEIQDALFSRIGATLGWPNGSGPGGNGGSTPGRSDPSDAAPGGHFGGGAHLAAHGTKHLVAGSLAKTLATLAVGGVLGAGAHEAYDRTHDRRPVPVLATAPAPARAAPASAPPELPVAPPVPATQPPPAPPAAASARADTTAAKPGREPRGEAREHDRNLAAERALIEQARTALARDNGAAALAVLERHARDFPRGELEEERESLQVQALVGLERYEQARKAGARFHRRFPLSIFGAVVDEALKSIP